MQPTVRLLLLLCRCAGQLPLSWTPALGRGVGAVLGVALPGKRRIARWNLDLVYGDRLDEAGRHHLQRIRAASQRLDRLLDNLLKLSRISQSRMERVPVNLSGMARAVALALKEEQPRRAAEFVIERQLRAVGDPLLLRALLENLLGNAW